MSEGSIKALKVKVNWYTRHVKRMMGNAQARYSSHPLWSLGVNYPSVPVTWAVFAPHFRSCSLANASDLYRYSD